jgi:hypothetical protein
MARKQATECTGGIGVNIFKNTSWDSLTPAYRKYVLAAAFPGAQRKWYVSWMFTPWKHLTDDMRKELDKMDWAGVLHLRRIENGKRFREKQQRKKLLRNEP